MDVLRNNHNGQSTVEYIMLIAVLSTITFSILNSDFFRDLFGENSSFFEETRRYLQFTYQHGRPREDTKTGDASYKPGEHHATYNEGGDKTHFFVPRDPSPVP